MKKVKLTVKFTDRTLGFFQKLGTNVPWDTLLKDYDFPCEPDMTIGDMATWIEQVVERVYSASTGDKMKIQVQASGMWSSKSDEKLDFEEEFEQHFEPGDTAIVEAIFLGPVSESFQMPPRWTAQDIAEFRRRLRFALNDRVICYCGSRWLSGHIVGTAVEEEDDLLPYLVKTDPLAGLPGRTISVPSDSDRICIQEVCFDPQSQLHLVKAAATAVPESSMPKLRFSVGEKVVCRIRNNPQDDLEQWASGTIRQTWAKLPGEQTWELGGVSGKYPAVVPYEVEIASGHVYCHRDTHTLIRREGMQPQTRVRGISKRMELRQAEDGSKERIDHMTERRKRLATAELSDSE
jgi:hypothetical protein